jgi:hypothetical protein
MENDQTFGTLQDAGAHESELAQDGDQYRGFAVSVTNGK